MNRLQQNMVNRTKIPILILLAGVMALAIACGASPQAEPAAAVVTLENKGSDTMVNLALAWAEAYQITHGAVRLSVTGGGTGTGIAALINDTVDVANASRAIKAEEREKARANGVEPVEFVVARDAIAIIVHPDNPVERLTLEQISALYRGEITNWQAVGGDDRPVVLLSRETNSGTHVFFLENVIRLGRSGVKDLFAPQTLLMPSSEGITAEARQNPNAIGYDGLGYVTDDVKVLAIAASAEAPYVLPTIDTVNDKSYPIARDLYMYTAGEPQAEVLKYMDWIVGAEAQAIVAALGFVPIR